MLAETLASTFGGGSRRFSSNTAQHLFFIFCRGTVVLAYCKEYNCARTCAPLIPRVDDAVFIVQVVVQLEIRRRHSESSANYVELNVTRFEECCHICQFRFLSPSPFGGRKRGASSTLKNIWLEQHSKWGAASVAGVIANAQTRVLVNGRDTFISPSYWRYGIVLMQLRKLQPVSFVEQELLDDRPIIF